MSTIHICDLTGTHSEPTESQRLAPKDWAFVRIHIQYGNYLARSYTLCPEALEKLGFEKAVNASDPGDLIIDLLKELIAEEFDNRDP